MNEYEGIEAELTGKIISKALKIHQDLGPSILESVYEIYLRCSWYRLAKKRI